MESDIENFLQNYFNGIRWVDNDIVIDEIVTTSKQDGQVISKTDKNIYNLRSLLTPSLEEVNRLLYLEINQCDKIDLKEPGFFAKLKGKSIFDTIKIDDNNWIITSSELYYKYFHKLDKNIYVADNFKDLIIVGDKNTNLILHRDLTKFYIDCSSIKVYKIKKSR